MPVSLETHARNCKVSILDVVDRIMDSTSLHVVPYLECSRGVFRRVLQVCIERYTDDKVASSPKCRPSNCYAISNASNARTILNTFVSVCLCDNRMYTSSCDTVARSIFAPLQWTDGCRWYGYRSMLMTVA